MKAAQLREKSQEDLLKDLQALKTELSGVSATDAAVDCHRPEGQTLCTSTVANPPDRGSARLAAQCYCQPEPVARPLLTVAVWSWARVTTFSMQVPDPLASTSSCCHCLLPLPPLLPPFLSRP